MRTASPKQLDLARSLGLNVSAHVSSRWLSQQLDQRLAEKADEDTKLYDEANRCDMLSLASQYTSLHKTAHNNHCGPCPMSGCRSQHDGFWVNTDTNTGGCHSCDWVWTNGSGSGPVGFLRAKEGLEAWEARDWLLGRSATTFTTTIPKAPPTPQKKRYIWRTSSWQAEAVREMEQAQHDLFYHPQAQPVRDYLIERGLTDPVWHAFKLGAALNPSFKRIGHTLTIPWITAKNDVTHIKYRLTQPIKRKNGWQKYDSKPDGKAYIFGAHLRTGTAPTLILCEGEINAMSIWLAALRLQLNRRFILELAR